VFVGFGESLFCFKALPPPTLPAPVLLERGVRPSRGEGEGCREGEDVGAAFARSFYTVGASVLRGRCYRWSTGTVGASTVPYVSTSLR
jgi:hypothetical protein